MGLKEELSLYKSIESIEHECLLNIVYTGTTLSKLANKYFSKYGITDAQFNTLMILKYSENEGVSQVVLSKRLLVNKADMTGLIDRLEKVQLAQRIIHPKDRRINLIKITEKGLEKLLEVEPNYFKAIEKLMGELGRAEIEKIVKGMEKMRENINKTGLL